MMERWGTLSVNDHLDEGALVSDLLLYDRLVIPVLSGEGERTRWRNEGWDPERQEMYTEMLGDLTVRAPWDKERQEYYADLRRQTRQVGIDAFQTTRAVLAMDQRLELPPDTDVRVVAAFHSPEECRNEMGVTNAQDCEGRLGFLLAQHLLVPSVDRKAPTEAVKVAAELSRDPRFSERRRAFYEWQEQAVGRIVCGLQTTDSAVTEMQHLIHDLNESIKSSRRSLLVKSVFTLVGVSLPFALGLEPLSLAAAIPGAFDLVKFALFDAREPHPRGRCEAAAMFVAAQKKIETASIADRN